MNYRNKTILSFVFFTCISVLMRKHMIPGASQLLTLSLSVLCVVFFINALKSFSSRKTDDNDHPLFTLAWFEFAFSSIAFLLRSQYWDGYELFLWIAFTMLILLSIVFIYYFFFRHTTREAEKRIRDHLFIPFLFFMLTIPFSVFSNQRQFHNFFRGSTYESYVRQTYPEDEAKNLLEENQCDDPACQEKAEEYFKEGILDDSLKKYDEAFECYNNAIDLNIHFAEAYVKRAANRMLHSEVDKEIIQHALRDCSIAIELKPAYAGAFLRRGFTNILGHHTLDACNDFRKAKSLDSTLKIDNYIRSTCGK
ncbi:MAG: hypothetical protein NT126_11230 [Bacteroidetes bacterium]|nr:hypothetical protein [Bacteroidota bacterium]